MEQGTCGELCVRGVGSSVLGVLYGAGYMWGVVFRGTLWSKWYLVMWVWCDGT